MTTYLLISVLSFSRAQMWNGTDSLYGNEWIRYDQTYFKIAVAADGIYRIPYAALSAAGIPVEELSAGQYQLWWLGQEQPLYTSTNETLSEGDFLEFYGRKNRSELDRHLFQDPDNEMLNPWYSLFTDTSAYFLTWVSPGEPTLRYEQVENELANLPAKEEWFWGEAEVVFSNQHNKKGYRVAGETISLSEFEGDGFSRGSNSAHDFNFNSPGVYAAGPEGSLHLRMLSNANTAGHHLQVRINDQLRAEEEYSGSEMRIFDFPMAPGALGTAVNIKVNGLNNNDRYAVAGARLRYPRQFSLGNASFFQLGLPAGSGARYLELSGLSGNQPPVLLDLTNELRLGPVEEGGLWKVKLPAAAGERNLVVSRAIRQVDNLAPVAFTDYSETQAEFIIISNERLFDDGQGNNRVQEYADYRATPDGGGYSTIVVEIGQLYDQFAYGVQRTPIGIRNFGHYIKRNWDNPRYVLLIGKGRTFNTTRTASALADPKNSTFYLPTFGYPGSDNLLLAKPGSNVPVIPTGRIAASDGDDVRMYLEKAKGFGENARAVDEESRAWKKEVLHLGGGGSPAEQEVIKNALKGMENILESSSFGANIYSFSKTSSDPIQQSQSGEITRRMNEGVSLITFFGHSGTEGFDFSIDDPSAYQNYQRYPAILSLGCYSGNIHLNQKTVGENFLFQEGKGAIAFLATVDLGSIYELNIFVRSFYDKLGKEPFAEGIGDILKDCIRDFDQNPGFFLQSLVQQFTLSGDPSLAITPYPAADFLFERTSVEFNPPVINAQQDSFDITLFIKNIGKAIQDSLLIEAVREFPDGAQIAQDRLSVKTPAYRDSIHLRWPTYGKRAVGFNKLYLKLDAEDGIAEGPLPDAELNNELVGINGGIGLPFFVFSNGISPVYPPDEGIIGNPSITLKASTANPFAPEQKYLLEIDTSAEFNSPFKRSTEIVQVGGVVEWNPGFVPVDSTVYYWRVTTDSVAGLAYNWEAASFLFLEGSSPGWGQSHFFQKSDNFFRNMELSTDSRRFKYLDNVKTVRVRNGVYPGTWPEIAVNNDPYIYIPWDNPVRGGVAVCVLDSLTGDQWLNNPPGYYGSHLLSPWATNYGAFVYSTREAEGRQKLINFLRDTIPAGNYVALYTIQYDNVNYEPEEWAEDSISLGVNLFQILEQEGAVLLRQAAESGAKPYILFYKKGSSDFPVFEKIAELDEFIVEAFNINGIWYSGSVRTAPIGPAESWGSLHWKLSETEAGDDFSFDLFGVRTDSVAVLLREGMKNPDTTLSWVDAGEYPFLRLHYNSSDTTNRTAPQLDYWRVLFEGQPDLALQPNAFLNFKADTLQRGEPLEIEVAAVNLTPTPIDSFYVKYEIRSESLNSQAYTRRYPPVPGGDTIHLHFKAPTTGLRRAQQLFTEINPKPGLPEINRFNNLGLLNFWVSEDMINPILDVTFDGNRILDGELVSAKPEIIIRIMDENPYLKIEDTSALKIFLKFPDEQEARPVSMSAPGLLFSIEDGRPGSRASVRYRPEFEKSGLYTLLVQGQDVSGNQSGQFDYKVSFQVETESRISNVLNYPNPFSNSTYFIYTLTGSEPPVDFMIRIMTVSGRVVRELTINDLGPLKIGTHQTEYAWDGTDEYGDRLANGVYLYRVIVRNEDGSDIEKFDNDTGRFFKNEIGKLVILR